MPQLRRGLDVGRRCGLAEAVLLYVRKLVREVQTRSSERYMLDTGLM